jgi:hypothetical protein
MAAESALVDSSNAADVAAAAADPVTVTVAADGGDDPRVDDGAASCASDSVDAAAGGSSDDIGLAGVLASTPFVLSSLEGCCCAVFMFVGAFFVSGVCDLSSYAANKP